MVSGVETITGLTQLTEVLTISNQEKISNQFLLELQKVNDKQIASEHLLQDMASGKTDNIHHVMMSLEDAKMSLQMLVQVRNKLLEGYQEVLRMQV
ncbi:MAG: flagellar hook-basal body complex protein FliE [Methylotenera sp.]